MDPLYKKIIVIIAAVFILYLMYYGSYLPLRKSQLLIEARTIKVQSFQEFDALFNRALDFKSPIGEEEVVFNYLNMLTSIIDQVKDEKIVRMLVQEAGGRAQPIIDRGVGLNFSQILYNLGIVYREAAFKFRDPDYYRKAIIVLEMGRRYSPNRPIFLQELFNLYHATGNKEKLQEIADIIIKLWPKEKEGILRILKTSQ